MIGAPPSITAALRELARTGAHFESECAVTIVLAVVLLVIALVLGAWREEP